MDHRRPEPDQRPGDADTDTQALNFALPESMARPKVGRQCSRHNASSISLLLLLLLGVGVPVCQPFGGFSSNSLNLRLTSCRMITSRTAVAGAFASRRHRRRRSSSSRGSRIPPSLSTAAVAAAAGTPGGGDEGNNRYSIGDVITGSNQLESWDPNMASSTSSTSSTPAAEAPKRSNVMGRPAATAAAATTTRRSVGSIGGSDTGPTPLPPPPPPPRLERDGGGVVRGEASPAWRVETATTSEELLSCFKVRSYCRVQ